MPGGELVARPSGTAGMLPAPSGILPDGIASPIYLFNAPQFQLSKTCPERSRMDPTFYLAPLPSVPPSVGGTSGRDRFLLSKFPWHADALAKEATFYLPELTSIAPVLSSS